MTEKVLQEITEKRDRYTKHFMLPEKGTAAAVYPEPVHYETESGWEEIDNRLAGKNRKKQFSDFNRRGIPERTRRTLRGDMEKGYSGG